MQMKINTKTKKVLNECHMMRSSSFSADIYDKETSLWNLSVQSAMSQYVEVEMELMEAKLDVYVDHDVS